MDSSWEAAVRLLPHGAERKVLWVEVARGKYRHRLLGSDHYWILGNLYGVANHHDYGGRMFSAWEWQEAGGSRFVGPIPPPDGATVLDGVRLPDEVWNRLRES